VSVAASIAFEDVTVTRAMPPFSSSAPHLDWPELYTICGHPVNNTALCEHMISQGFWAKGRLLPIEGVPANPCAQRWAEGRSTAAPAITPGARNAPDIDALQRTAYMFAP
jgi:hypothetical protein